MPVSRRRPRAWSEPPALVPAHRAAAPRRQPVRHAAQLAPRTRRRDRGYASVSPGRPDLDDRVGRLGAALGSARGRRVHRARAVRGGGAGRRDRARPARVDGHLPAAVAVARQAASHRDRRARDRRRAPTTRARPRRVRCLADRVAAPRTRARTDADRALARRAGHAHCTRERARRRGGAACCGADAHCRPAASSS